MIRTIFIDAKGHEKNLGDAESIEEAVQLVRANNNRLFVYNFPVSLSKEEWEAIGDKQKQYTLGYNPTGISYRFEEIDMG